MPTNSFTSSMAYFSSVTLQARKQQPVANSPPPPSSFKPRSLKASAAMLAPPQAPSSLHRHSTRSFSLFSSSPTPSRFVATVSTPAVFAGLAARLDWPDLLSLLNTCRGCRSLFRNAVLRDLLLSHLVPGYADALRFRDATNYYDVPVSIHDLDLLLISLKLPLHRYPTHALRLLTALYPTLEDDYITTKLVALSLAHSRFVLLLQALVHSSSSALPPPEPEPISRWSRRVFSQPATSAQSSRQLNFPAPLSYLKEQERSASLLRINAPLPDPPVLSKRLKHHSLPTRSKSLDPSYSHFGQAIEPSADRLSTMISIGNTYGEPHETNKTARRRSIFRKPLVTPPPPEEPRALRNYSKTWRKNIDNCGHNSYLNPVRQPANLDDLASFYGSDEFILERPRRRFASANVSSDSSVSSSPVSSASPLPRIGGGDSGSSSGGRSSPSTPPPGATPMSMSLSPLPMTIRTSPHDLHLATSRVRAPILRVFVPCTKMEVDSDSVLACERYLVEAGLWQHLSTGDVVCNMGYIPPTTSDSDAGEDDRDSFSTRFASGSNYRSSSLSSGRSGSSASGTNNTFSRKWLLFNGECLVPYTALDVLPIDNPISLPSPYYYAHILPGNGLGFGPGHAMGGATNIRFSIEKFPPVMDEVPQMAMVNVAGRVKSVRAPAGWVEVRKWVWTARVGMYKPNLDLTSALSGSSGSSSSSYSDGLLVQKQQLQFHQQTLGQFGAEIGEGWYGEWVLEGEGTGEGRQFLLDIFNKGVVPGGPREWELVRERCGNGRIWLRIVS